MDSLAFNQDVQQIEFDDRQRQFVVTTSNKVFHAKHVSIGIGENKVAGLRDGAKRSLFPRQCEMLRNPDLTGKRVAIVGARQSGRSVPEYFRGMGQPEQLDWISRRNNYNALDEAAFATNTSRPITSRAFTRWIARPSGICWPNRR